MASTQQIVAESRSWSDRILSREIDAAPPGELYRLLCEERARRSGEGRALTQATPRNMAAFEAANPARTIPQGDGSKIIIEGRRAVALSPSTGEEYGASSGDYWQLPADEPLRDSDGEPMLLVTRHTIYKDAMTGERL